MQDLVADSFITGTGWCLTWRTCPIDDIDAEFTESVDRWWLGLRLVMVQEGLYDVFFVTFYLVARVDDLMIIGSPRSCFVVLACGIVMFLSMLFSRLSLNFELPDEVPDFCSMTYDRGERSQFD